MRELLKLRGVTNFEVVVKEGLHCHLFPCWHVTYGQVLGVKTEVESMIGRFDVVKGTRDEKKGEKLAEKDFPGEAVGSKRGRKKRV